MSDRTDHELNDEYDAVAFEFEKREFQLHDAMGDRTFIIQGERASAIVSVSRPGGIAVVYSADVLELGESVREHSMVPSLHPAARAGMPAVVFFCDVVSRSVGVSS